MKRTLVSIYLWFFIVFDFISILLLVSLTTLLSFPFDKNRNVSNKIMLFFGGLILKAWPGWNVTLYGEEHLKKDEAVVFISNHQSFLDMPLHTHLSKNFKWVSKVELFSIPVMGWFMKLTKQLSVNRGKSSAADLLNQAIPVLKDGISICIFAEGTRTRNGDLQPFKKGAFALAKEAGAKIQPLVLDGTFPLNPPDDWRFNDKGDIQLHILPTIDPNEFDNFVDLSNYTHQIFEAKMKEIRGL